MPQHKSPYTRPSKSNPAHSYAAPKPDRRKRRYYEADDLDDLIDDLDSPPPPTFHGDPAAVIPPGTPLVVQGKKYFKPAHHQRTIRTHFWGRFGIGMEERGQGFRILRNPRTGEPVVRDHGDLKPGEVSLVLE